MKYLPLFINLKSKSILVIGGGIVASRKIQVLQKVGAVIKIVAPIVCEELKNKLLFEKNITWIGEKFHPIMLDTVVLVIVATNDDHLNSVVYANAERRHILINTVDNIDKCSCIFPSIINRSPILIGISSCGQSPVLTRILREKIESLLPMSIGYVARLAGKWRKKVKQYIIDPICRRRFWEKIFYDGHIFTVVEQGHFKKAHQILKNTLNVTNDHVKQGNVTLVGAGPGDIGLLTIRGLQAIQQADVVLYDALININMLDLIRRDADKICVGKRFGRRSMSQQEINTLIIQLAQQGNRVVRLKGGDSFIFGRGGEELQRISELGIPFQVVPGITSGIGVSAYAGIPLTHREYANSVTFITGYQAYNDYTINWNNLSDKKQTLVIYMGTFNAENISKNLINHGRDAHTPVAIISNGTYYNQKVLIGTLTELSELTQTVKKPALLVIGDVVLLCKKIHWFSKLSLGTYKINSIINLM